MKKLFYGILFTLLAAIAPVAQIPFSEDFESYNTTDSTNWNSCANGDEYSAGVGGWTNIGKCYGSGSINRTGRFGVAHGGTKSARITIATDEHEARMRRNHIGSDSVYIRMLLFFDANYDHAYGEKLFRLSAVDSVGTGGCSSGSLFWDMIFYMRSSTQTSGKDDMASFIGEANGGSGGAIGGGAFIGASINFPRSTWFQLGVKIKLPTGITANGVTTIKYNDSTIASLTNIDNMRTSSRSCGYSASSDTHQFSFFSPVGWYSNGICGGCANPNVPAIKYVDDICIGRNETDCPSLVSGGSAPVVTVDPVSADKRTPSTATFAVTATNATSYQWQKGTTNVSSGTGGTTDTYTTPATTGADNNTTYRCIVTNAYGADTSAAATLTISVVRRGFGGMTPSFRH